MSDLYTLPIALYVIPFLVLAVMPGWKSWGAATIVLGAALAFIWLYVARHAKEADGLGEIFVYVFLIAMTAGAALGVVARGLLLICGWSASQAAGALTSIVCLLAGPGGAWGLMTYDAWRLRPPSAACAARPSFDIVIDEVRLRVPVAPFVFIRGDRQSYSLMIPQSLRDLCAAADRHDGRVDAAALTLFFDKAVSEATVPAMKRWAAEGCGHASPAFARLACPGTGAALVYQMTIYGKRGFDGRVGSVGVAPSHEFFHRQQAEGKHPPGEAERHGSSLVYPGGIWVMDDSAAVFECSPARQVICRGDLVLAPGLFAKTYFSPQGGDVEGTYDKVRDATKALYAEWTKAAEAER